MNEKEEKLSFHELKEKAKHDDSYMHRLQQESIYDDGTLIFKCSKCKEIIETQFESLEEMDDEHFTILGEYICSKCLGWNINELGESI